MQSARPFIMCLQISRRISSSSMCANINREGRFMKKIMHGSRKSKRMWYDTSTDLNSAVSINPTDKSPSIHTTRRMIIRDKLFMEHITDMMSMEEVSDILKEDIEITHVKITPDFKYVNVFWIPNNDDVSLVDEEVLQKCAKIIRHGLSQLRVIGVVPPIQFVQNKRYIMEKEVERRLATINFEDSETLSCSEEGQLETSDVNSVDQTFHKELSTNRDSETDGFCIQLPVMRHDILGLDHYKIMSQITSAVSKSKKAAQRRILDANINTESLHNPVSKEVEFLTREEQQKIFSDFLIKRRREEQRRYSLKSDKQKLLNNFKEEIDEEIEESDYEDGDIDDKYVDIFEDETQKKMISKRLVSE